MSPRQASRTYTSRVDRVALQRLLEDLLNLLPAFHSRQMQKAERDLNWPSCPWVFHYLGKPIGGHIKGFVEACVKAGLPKLRAHDLRRSAIRNMERAAVPRSTAMKFSGHKTESVYRRYDIVSQQDMKLAAAKMENYLEGLKSRNITTKTTTVEEKPN